MALVEWDHLKKANASWFRHWYIAMYFAGIAFLVFITGVIHAFFPPLFGFLPYRLAKEITDGTEKTFPACIVDEETENE